MGRECFKVLLAQNYYNNNNNVSGVAIHEKAVPVYTLPSLPPSHSPGCAAQQPILVFFCSKLYQWLSFTNDMSNDNPLQSHSLSWESQAMLLIYN